MKTTRREAMKSAIAVGALAALPAAAPAKQKLIGVKVYVLDVGGKCFWRDITWDRLRCGDFVRFEDEPGKLYVIQSRMYRHPDNGAPTVRLEPMANGNEICTRRLSDELLRNRMRHLKDKGQKIELASLESADGHSRWIPFHMEYLTDGDRFRDPRFPLYEYTLFTL